MVSERISLENFNAMVDIASKKTEKKTMGRRKIEIRKIEKKTSLQVTFTKRRTGLFRKASELFVLCGAEIAILVQSPADKIFAFGHPSVEALIGRFESGGAVSPETGASSFRQFVEQVEDRSAVRRLEMEKRMKEGGREFWWDEPFEGLELQELEEYAEALEVLRDNVSQRVEALAFAASFPDNDDDDQGFLVSDIKLESEYGVFGFSDLN
ncbi:hypothetical protein DH2020_017577 [Rehmannia glutinosa]|uniref:MADS-box domain-containing protein n=1 Tax=Rehmannia glutinosa TaxID=99300 RepID=A0ABR0WRH6_REHGL